MDWLTLAGELEPQLSEGRLDVCITAVSDQIRLLPLTPFHDVLVLDFTNAVEPIVRHLEAAITMVPNVSALYAEMNGFYINPDRWYFELFAYRTYGGNENYNWLAEDVAVYPEKILLTGMESLQNTYERHLATLSDDSLINSTIGLCDLLIVLYFQRLIQRSASVIQKLNIPILATAHDYDFIYEFKH